MNSMIEAGKVTATYNQNKTLSVTIIHGPVCGTAKEFISRMIDAIDKKKQGMNIDSCGCFQQFLSVLGNITNRVIISEVKLMMVRQVCKPVRFLRRKDHEVADKYNHPENILCGAEIKRCNSNQ